jgi:hypothetical protein
MASEYPKGGLRFERADFDEAPASLTCGACGGDVFGVYYTVGGRVSCERCKSDLDLNVLRGSRIGRFLKATFYGVAAGAVGAGIWYAVRAVTGYELGLIAILVGLFVGGAVRKGSGGRGGWRYQALAMFLTYASIVSTYVPEVVTLLQGTFDEKKEAGAAASPAPPAGAAATAPSSTSSPEASPVEASVVPSAEAAPRGAVVLLALLLYGLLVLAIAFAAPFLGGVQGFMGLVIVGIALYEAWKINRATPLVITGPHRVGLMAPPPAPPAEGE